MAVSFRAHSSHGALHLGLTQGATVQLVPVGAQEASYTSLDCRNIHTSGTSGTRELVPGCLAVDIMGL